MGSNLNLNPTGFNSFGINNNNLQNSFSNNYSGNNYYNTTVNSNNLNQINQPFQSLDGRKWESKSDEFAANKEYYQKMLDDSTKSN